MNNIIINEDWLDQSDERNELNLSSNLIYEQAIDYFIKISMYTEISLLIYI